MTKSERLIRNEVGNVTVVRLRDRAICEEATTDEVFGELFHLVEVDGGNRLLLDLVSVSTMSSVALGRLIALHRKAAIRGGDLKLCHVSPKMYQILTTTRLDRLFDVSKDDAAGIEALSSGVTHQSGSSEALFQTVTA
ncbi:MAG: STAS domain-containing protein [Planctomycetota bacterium]|jgi:anti-anti-sigma factor